MSLKSNIKPIVYGVFNVAVGCGIVFANKAVLSVFNFKFVYALTLVHTIVTMIGMWMFAAGGIFEIKRFKALQVRPSGRTRLLPEGPLNPSLCLILQHRPTRPTLIILLFSAIAGLNVSDIPAGRTFGSCFRGVCGILEPEPADKLSRLLPAVQDHGATISCRA